MDLFIPDRASSIHQLHETIAKVPPSWWHAVIRVLQAEQNGLLQTHTLTEGMQLIADSLTWTNCRSPLVWLQSQIVHRKVTETPCRATHPGRQHHFSCRVVVPSRSSLPWAPRSSVHRRLQPAEGSHTVTSYPPLYYRFPEKNDVVRAGWLKTYMSCAAFDGWSSTRCVTPVARLVAFTRHYLSMQGLVWATIVRSASYVCAENRFNLERQASHLGFMRLLGL